MFLSSFSTLLFSALVVYYAPLEAPRNPFCSKAGSKSTSQPTYNQTAGLLNLSLCSSSISQQVALRCSQMSYQGWGGASSGIKRTVAADGDLGDCREKALGQKAAEKHQHLLHYLFFVCLSVRHDFQDLSSPSRDRTRAPCSGSMAS